MVSATFCSVSYRFKPADSWKVKPWYAGSSCSGHCAGREESQHQQRRPGQLSATDAQWRCSRSLFLWKKLAEEMCNSCTYFFYGRNGDDRPQFDMVVPMSIIGLHNENMPSCLANTLTLRKGGKGKITNWGKIENEKKKKIGGFVGRGWGNFYDWNLVARD